MIVCKSDELAPGTKMAARVGPVPIVVIRTMSGRLYALGDRCLHQGGPLSKGVLGWDSSGSRTVGEYLVERDGMILRCPWHGYEYNIDDGTLLVDHHRALPRFTVEDVDGNISVELRPPRQDSPDPRGGTA